MNFILIAVVVLALSFGFLNGAHTSRNMVSTIISSRAFSPSVALGVTALSEFVGPFIFGAAVAETIGRDIVISSAVNDRVMLAALASAVTWNIVTWFFHLPSTSSHALLGGLLGAALMRSGAAAIQAAGLIKTLLFLFISPIIGMLFGFVIFRLIVELSRKATPRINTFFKKAQLITTIALGLSHGTNDGQKSMGIIVLALMASGYLSSFVIPLWVIILCAAAFALGTLVGGWKLIHTVGGILFYKIRPIDGFATQLASSIVILGSSLLGGPVSATQVINTSIMGVGMAERVSKVRWHVAQDIIAAWLLTIPATSALAAALYWLIARL
ncbi:MAG: inorganic phosphate transporter [Anaerolineales bacterium]|nr:inorganic phosphate transporter [Anaerolineales bacterium]